MAERYSVVDLSNCSESVKWDVDDVKLLFSCLKEFKTTRESEGIDWETIKTKYEAIRIIFQREKGDCEDMTKYTRDRIATKVKALRANYRKAVESGVKNSAGRTAAIFFDLCKEIWPDVIPTGNHMPIRSIVDVYPTKNIAIATPPGVDPSVYYEQVHQENPVINFKRENAYCDENGHFTNEQIPTTNATAIRDREHENGSKTNSSTKNYDTTTAQNENTTASLPLPTLRLIHDKKKKSDKRAASPSVEQQLLDIVKEDFAFKRQLLAHISRQDEQFNTALLGMQQTITTFTQSMSSFMERLNRDNHNSSQHKNQDGETQSQPATSSSNTTDTSAEHCSCRCRRSRHCWCCC